MRPAATAALALGLSASLAIASGACAQGRGRGPSMGGFGARFAARPVSREPCAEANCSMEQRLAARHARREAHGGFYDVHGRYQH